LFYPKTREIYQSRAVSFWFGDFPHPYITRDATTKTQSRDNTPPTVMADDTPWQDRDPNNEDEDDDVDENVPTTDRGC
jgi:hypothetical protein